MSSQEDSDNDDILEVVDVQNGDEWKKKFAELKVNKAKVGNCDVNAEEKPELAAWVSEQCDLYHQDFLRTDRQEMLESLGLEFEEEEDDVHESIDDDDLSESAWNENYNKLLTYHKKHGHSDCPSSNTEGASQALGRWVIKQRTLRRRNELRSDRKEKLDKVGLTWEFANDFYEELWNEKYQMLVAFVEKCGSFKVIRKMNEPLYNWVKWQRRVFQQGKLTPHRESMLRKINFPFKVDATNQPQPVTSSATARPGCVQG